APRPFPYLPSCITDCHLNALSASPFGPLSRLTSLSLCHCVALTDMSIIQIITPSSPCLKRIDLTECRLITNLTVQVIAQLCSYKLEELSIQGCALVTDDAIEELAYRCRRLRRINLGLCHRLSDRSLLALLRGSTGLSTTSTTTTTTSAITAAWIGADRAPRLEKLGIAGCHGITLGGLLAITEQMSLPESDKSGLECERERITSSTIGSRKSYLVSLEINCPALKKTPNKTQHGGGHLFSTTLTSHSTISQATRLFQTLPTTLEEITLFDAYTLSPDDITCLVDRVGSSLKTLRLDNANAVDSETLAHILAACPYLTVLCIPRATRLDDYGVIQLMASRCAQSLVELDLSACHSLTDACLTRLATSRPPTPTYSIIPTSSSSTSPFKEDLKGKRVDDQEREPPCLFPNLRRLDLSYNDKLTLTGIIPLIISLKNLCALDVSFCGDGVTRSWSSSLESLRPLLNPASIPIAPSALKRTDEEDMDATDSAESMSEVQDRLSSSQSSSSHQHLDHTQQATAASSSALPSLSSGSAFFASSTIQQALSLQSVQQYVSGVIPSRRGLGRYVGPLLSRPPAAHQDNSVTPEHPQQYPGQGQEHDRETQQHGRRRSSASSATSACSTSSSYSSASSVSSSSSLASSASPSSSSILTTDLCDGNSYSTNKKSQERLSHKCNQYGSSYSKLPHGHHFSVCSSSSASSSTSLSPGILLADRLDVLDNTPRRVGLPARFHLESWFTPQHQQQLQQLFHIQLQHQREVQDQQQAAFAAMAVAATNGNNNSNDGGNGHSDAMAAAAGLGEAGAGAATAATTTTTVIPTIPTTAATANTAASLNSRTTVSLSVEMMAHPVMMAPRAGAATIRSGDGVDDDGESGDEGEGLFVIGRFRRHQQQRHLQQQRRQRPQPQAQQVLMHQRPYHGSIELAELNDNLNTNLHLGSQHSPAGRFAGAGAGGRGVNHAHQHHRHHGRQHHNSYYERRGSSGNIGSGRAVSGLANVSGYCEISAWGLSKLKEEWSIT
ncbi:hypothetical protein BGZ98_005028, partial [Dissophora globulifera]